MAFREGDMLLLAAELERELQRFTSSFSSKFAGEDVLFYAVGFDCAVLKLGRTVCADAENVSGPFRPLR